MALGILVVPTRWFWDGTLRDFHDTRFKRNPYIVLTSKLGRISLQVFNDGYVTLDTSNRRLAADRLNALLLALGLVTGRGSDSVTEKSLEEVEIKNGERVRKRWSMHQLGNFIETYPTSELPGRGTDYIRREMEINLRSCVYGTEELKLAISLSNKFVKTGNPAAVTQHLEATNHFVEGDWMASALLGWITIEKAIDNELILKWEHEGVPHAEAVRKAQDLKEYWVIEKLKEGKPLRIGKKDPTVLTKRKLERIHGLRELRNEIVHEGKRSTKRDAYRMKKGSEMAMWRMFRHNEFDYAGLYERVKEANRAREVRLWTLDRSST